MLTDGWRKATLGSIARANYGLVDGPFGSNLPASDYTDSGVPVIRGCNLSFGQTRFNDNDFVFVSEATAHRLSRSLCEAGDVVFTKKGTLGQTGIVPRHPKFEKFLLSSNQMKLSVDPTKADPLFVYYVVSSQPSRSKIIQDSTITGVPKTNLAYLRDFPIFLPPLAEQNAIAKVLGAFDEKIELSERMNKTLESMAQALFKSWFVDFDPTRAKAEGREFGIPKALAELYPSSFEDSELGAIPAGWMTGRFGDVVELLREQENPLSSPETVFHHFSIPAFDSAQQPKTEFGSNIMSLKFKVSPNVILLSKLNPEIERVWLVDVQPDERAICSTEFLVLRPRDPFGRAYAYCLARSSTFRQQIEALVTGTSKSHQRAQADSVLQLPVILPPPSIVQKFEALCSVLLSRTLSCRRESQTLGAIRETLLPRLISGEFRISFPERILGGGV